MKKFLLILLQLMKQGVIAVTFTKNQIPTEIMNLVMIMNSSMLSCSQGCAMAFPGCKVFKWENKTCYQGTIDYKRVDYQQEETVFIEASELRLWQLVKPKYEEWVNFFQPVHHVYKDYVYWRSNGTATDYSSAKASCEFFGAGLVTNVREQDVFDFFKAKDLLSATFFSWIGLVTKTGNATECSGPECNGKYVWEDGIDYEHNGNFSLFYSYPLGERGGGFIDNDGKLVIFGSPRTSPNPLAVICQARL